MATSGGFPGGVRPSGNLRRSSSAGFPTIVAAGNGGQFLQIIPDRDLIVVSTAKDYENTGAFLHIVEEYVLPAAVPQPTRR
jgi:hypothetical protein